MDPATVENLNHEWSPQDTPKTRRLKVILPQFYAALAIFAVNLSHVTFESTCHIVTHPKHIETTPYLAYGLGKLLGFLIGGIIAQITGARVIMILAGAVSIAGWIILELIHSETILQWTMYIVALAGGMMQAPSYVYLAEVSQPNMRNALVSTIFVSSGIPLIYFNLADRQTITIVAIVNIIFTLFGLIVMIFLPNSPHWLANKGRYHAAESSLAWFRGRTTVENVKSESKTIIGNAQSHPTTCEIFGQAPLYIAISIISYVFVASIFIRIFAVQFFSYALTRLWRQGYEELAAIHMTSYFGISIVLLSIGFVVLVAILGKRTIFLISLFGGTITILVASIAGYLNESNILSSDAYSWFLLISTTGAYSCLITSIEPVTLLLNAELFPSKVRLFGVGFGLFLMKIISLNVSLDVLVNLPLALLIMAFCSMIASISLLWIFPRNENKSLVEIEHSSKELYTSIKKSFYLTYIAKLITCKRGV